MATRIAFAGDWHATEWWARDCINSLPDDVRILIQLGDFGLMGPTRDEYVAAVNDCAVRRNIDVWVVPGNHEDYDWLEAQPVDSEGIAQIAERIAVLPRGHRFVIEQVVFCAVGGAVSRDQGHRTPGETWWPQEEITDAQAIQIASDGPADVLLTHDAPIDADPPSLSRSEIAQFAGVDLADKLFAHSQRIQDLSDALTPRRLLHGHLHARYNREVEATSATGEAYIVNVDGLACDRLAGNIVLMTIDGASEELEEFEVEHVH